MRIIKEGRKPAKEIEKTCERCGCLFAYERLDVKEVYQYQQLEHRSVVCPHCGYTIKVEPFPKW